MQNEFIEELRKKTVETTEEVSYKEELKQKFPWISDDILEEKFVEHTLKRMFNPKGGEER